MFSSIILFRKKYNSVPLIKELFLYRSGEAIWKSLKIYCILNVSINLQRERQRRFQYKFPCIVSFWKEKSGCCTLYLQNEGNWKWFCLYAFAVNSILSSLTGAAIFPWAYLSQAVRDSDTPSPISCFAQEPAVKLLPLCLCVKELESVIGRKKILSIGSCRMSSIIKGKKNFYSDNGYCKWLPLKYI